MSKGGELMPRRYKEARLMNKIKLTEMAERLGVSQPTLSSWESGRKAAPLEALIKMADIYGVTTDYLLGRDDQLTPNPELQITLQTLMALDGKPVWSTKYGWALVNATESYLAFSDGRTLPFTDAGEFYIAPPLFAEPTCFGAPPLSRLEMSHHTDIWVEPISPDSVLRKELRGWYRIKQRFVENEFGNRFYLDTYGSKWLAFENNI